MNLQENYPNLSWEQKWYHDWEVETEAASNESYK